jgi:hypothetical protein
MKSPNPSQINESLFKQHTGEQPVRLIKAAQAGKFLNASANGHGTVNGSHGSADLHKPEIRLIQSGADYCDLEVICGCGESTQVRCWNTPQAEEKGAF